MKLNNNDLQSPGKLPDGWTVTTLGTALPLTYGKALKKDIRDELGKVPVYGSSGQVGVHSTALTKKPALIVGRKGSVGEVYRSATPCWPIDTVYFSEQREDSDLKFFEYLLKGLKLNRLDKSTAVPGLSRDDYNAVEVAIAPLDQQKRIVAEIEKQFSRLDEAVANLKRVKANLKRYKAAVIKAAVEGRLVETEAELARREGRSFETGAQLLQRILETRRSQWKGKGKYKEPAAPDTSDLPELPEGWVWASMEQVVENYDGVRVPVRSKDREGRQGPYPYYGASGVIDHVDDFLFDGEYLLIAEDGANLLSRSTPIAFQASGKFWVNNHAHIVQTLGGIPLAFLEHYLNGKDLARFITGSAQPKLTQAAMNKIPVPLPGAIEQHRLVNEVDRRLSIIYETETQAEDNLKRCDRLRQSILERAFSGRLVPEDSNAKPVSELLVPIRAEPERAKATDVTQTQLSKPIQKEATVADLIEALKSAGGWISAQDAFRRCGVADGADTDKIEHMYAELRDLIRPGVIEVERRDEEDWLRLSQSKGA
jgi:type I restriction enzyme, S subunit